MFYFLCRLIQLASLVLSSSAFYSMVRTSLCSWWILPCALSFVIDLVVSRCLVFPFRCPWSFSFSAVWIFDIPINSVPLFLFPCRIHSMGSFVCRSGVDSGLIRSGLFAVVRFLRPYLYQVSRCRALALSWPLFFWWCVVVLSPFLYFRSIPCPIVFSPPPWWPLFAPTSVVCGCMVGLLMGVAPLSLLLRPRVHFHLSLRVLVSILSWYGDVGICRWCRRRSRGISWWLLVQIAGVVYLSLLWPTDCLWICAILSAHDYLAVILLLIVMPPIPSCIRYTGYLFRDADVLFHFLLHHIWLRRSCSLYQIRLCI